MRVCVSYEFSLLLFAGCVTGRVMQKAEESLLMRLKSSVLLNPDYHIGIYLFWAPRSIIDSGAKSSEELGRK